MYMDASVSSIVLTCLDTHPMKPSSIVTMISLSLGNPQNDTILHKKKKEGKKPLLIVTRRGRRSCFPAQNKCR